MNSPITAYLWELWRRSRWQLLGRLVFVVGYILLLATVMKPDGNEPMQRLLRGLVLIMLIPSSIFSPTWMGNFLNDGPGFTFRGGFIRPIKTWRLVVLPILYAVVASIVVYCIQATVLVVVTGERLPLLFPAIIIGTGVTWVLAAIWIPVSQFGRVLAITAVVIMFSAGAFFLHSSRAGSDALLMAAGRSDYMLLSWTWAAVLFISAIVAVAISVVGVGRQRCGDSLVRFGWSKEAIGVCTAPASMELLPVWPRSGYQSLWAQLWMEWKRCQATVLAMMMIVPSLLLLMQMVGPLVSENWHGSELIWLLALATCPFVYQMVACNAALGGKPDGSTGLTQFDFVRPLPCDQMMGIKIIAVFACSVIGWSIVASAALLHSLTGQTDTLSMISEFARTSGADLPLYWWGLGVACWLFLYACSTSTMFAWMLLASKYPKWIWAGTAFVFVHLIFVLLSARWEWSLRLLWTFYGYAGALAISVGSGYLLWRSVRSRVVGRSMLLATASIWVIFIVAIASVLAQIELPKQFPTAAIVFAASCLLVPLASAVSSPLALASHRHA